jgi:hypothetical protein
MFSRAWPQPATTRGMAMVVIDAAISVFTILATVRDDSEWGHHGRGWLIDDPRSHST